MYISEISITNFRGFKEVTTICFSEGINVIVGHNNAGKTTIIKALELLFGTNTSKKLTTDDFNKNTDKEFLKKEPPKIIITGKLVESENEEEYSNDIITVSTWLTKIDKPYEALITYEFSLPDKEKESYKNTLNQINSQDISDYWNEIEYSFIRKYTQKIYIGNPEYKMLIDSDSVNKFDFQYLNAIRDVERDMFSGRNSLLKEVIDFFIDYEIKISNKYNDVQKIEIISERKKEFSKDAGQLLVKLQERMKIGKKQMLKYVEETGAAFENIKPSFEGRILDTELYSALKLIVENETGIKLPASQNGLGYNNLIYISLLLAKMQKNASGDYMGTNLKVFPLLAIEEPEAHLHPNMQYKFLKFLNENSKHEVRQIFITTHSPNITAAVDLDSVIVLCKGAVGIEVAYPGKVFTDSDEDKASKKYVQRFLDVTKADMFFAKSLILVEGIAEQLLIPEFSGMLEISLTDAHVSIINVNGRYFSHFLKLFDRNKCQYAISKKVVCITDLDPVRKNIKEDDSSWESCLPILFNCDLDSYEYKANSNGLIALYPDKTDKDMIRVYTEKEGCTFEYEMLLENPKCKGLLTDSVSNKSEIDGLMDIFKKEEDVNKIVSKLRKGKFKTEIEEAVKKTSWAPEKIIKHIIAGRYLKSIKKGEVAQDLACIISENQHLRNSSDPELREKAFEFVVPTYISEAIKWICQ